MSFKVGDEVCVVKLTDRHPYSSANKTLNLIGNVIGVGKYFQVKFKAPINDWFNYEKDELELVPNEEKGEGKTKFKIGDRVRFIGNETDLCRSNLTRNEINLGQECKVAMVDDGNIIKVYVKNSQNPSGTTWATRGLTEVPNMFELINEGESKMKFKFGDKVKIVSINPFTDYEAKGVWMSSSRESYYNSMIGKTSTINDTEFAPLYILSEKDKTGPLCLFDSNLEIFNEGEGKMVAKFKVGDEVRVTASQGELNMIGALRAFGKVGKVEGLDDVYFNFKFIDDEVGNYYLNLNYAHAELVTPENREIKRLSVGDKFLINGQECTVYELNDEPSDRTYWLKSPLGMKFNLPNELAPIGSCKVPSKFEVGEIVLDTKTECICKIIRDDEDGNRYKVIFKTDDADFRRGVQLTKLPQEIFQDLFKE